MVDARPYQPPSPPAVAQRSQAPARLLALAIHFFLLFLILLGGPLLWSSFGVQPGTGTIETELSGSDDVLRAFANYAYVPVMLVLLLDFPVFFAVRRLKGKPTRWHWLGWTTTLIPVVLIAYWLVLWPLLRIPIEI